MSESGRVILPSYRLKQGDQVVMHTCGEAGDPDNYGKIWTCKTDQFTRGKGVYEQDSVFLEGYSGSFAPEFLQKVILLSEDESILSALKESQQEGARLKAEHAELLVKYHAEENRFQKRNEELAEAIQEVKEWQDEAKQWRDDFVDKNNELGEAQQTIARQQENEQALLYEVSEIYKEATVGNRGCLERADAALNRIMLLSSNLLALGNKEGACCSNPNVQTFNNEFVVNTRCCINCGRLIDVPVDILPSCPKCGSKNTLAHPNKAGIWLCAPCNQTFEEGDKSHEHTSG